MDSEMHTARTYIEAALSMLEVPQFEDRDICTAYRNAILAAVSDVKVVNVNGDPDGQVDCPMYSVALPAFDVFMARGEE